LLGGSVYSLLLLSGNDKLKALGVQVAFAGLRIALAATQTTDFESCMDTVNYPPKVTTIPWPPLPAPGIDVYKGKLFNALLAVPRRSGWFGAFQAYTPLPLGPDGTSVVCASIAMMSGNPNDATTYEWAKNVMWQGASDITNALYQTIETSGLLTQPQRKELCGATRAIYTLNTDDTGVPDVNDLAVVAVPFPPADPSKFDFDSSCWTTQGACSPASAGVRDKWTEFFQPKPQLEAGHDFTPGAAPFGSPFFRVCYDAFKP
jgi:hypothetical protein